MTDTEAEAAGVSVDDLAERVFRSVLGTFEIFSIHVGDRLGWYGALAESPLTPAQLADATSTSARYAREWLEQQAVLGFLETDPSAPADERVYALTSAAREVLTDPHSLAYLAPVARMLAASGGKLDALMAAYRSGGGVSWEQFGDDARWSQADVNRPIFERELAGALASVPELHQILAQPGARIADVGCGAGWSAIALAKAYPDATVDGFDVDGPSVDAARQNASEAGVGDRVSFNLAGGETVGSNAWYDAAFAFECVHDMPRPVEVLAGIRSALKPDAPLVVMDEAVAEEFTAPGDEIEQLMYGYSMFICLPDGMSSQPSVGTGTVMRPDTLASYGRSAGFERFDVLPIQDFAFFRFYRLRQ
jgi:2-polyprenyl-3-methyl-5-hydroxy-6-metoxy-1,4-benzoquinol methylase